MRVLCVGGGSGGHVTPIIAVIDAIKQRQPEAEIHFLTDKHFFAQAQKLIDDREIPVSTVMAGKLRRYANLKWYDHIRHIFISYVPNFFDFFKILIGIVQSWFKILKFRPDVVFIKGGYVGLPVGLAAALLWPRPPIVLHDSDATAGLTNRILSRYAVKIATGMPTKYYSYDPAKMVYVGMPIRPGIKSADGEEKKNLKDKLGYDGNSPFVLVMGGGQGSCVLNEAILTSYPVLKGRAEVLLLAGANNLCDVESQIEQNHRNFIKLHAEGFLAGERYIKVERAADIVITRAGATSLAELAALGAPTIIIPSPYLASDHQTKNAEVYADSGAAIVISEDKLDQEPYILADEVIRLLDDKTKRQKLSANIKKFAKTDATEAMAEIIIKAGDDKKK